MKKGTLVVISTILVVLGLILLVSSLSITGNVVSERMGKTTGSIFGLMLIISGIVLYMAGRETVLQRLERTLSSGKIGTYQDLERYAIKLGYNIKEGAGHVKIYGPEGHITNIPRHKKGVKKGLYRQVTRKLIEAAH
jgi:hypothetical protein